MIRLPGPLILHNSNIDCRDLHVFCSVTGINYICHWLIILKLYYYYPIQTVSQLNQSVELSQVSLSVSQHNRPWQQTNSHLGSQTVIDFITVAWTSLGNCRFSDVNLKVVISIFFFFLFSNKLGLSVFCHWLDW